MTNLRSSLLTLVIALMAIPCGAIQTVKPATSAGVQLTTMSQASGTIVEFYGQYESDFGGSESGLGLRVEFDATKLAGVTIDQVMTKCMIAQPQSQSGLSLANGNNAQTVFGWIDTSIRAAGAVGWPGVADPGGSSACLNPGGVVTQTGAVAIPTRLFRFRATLAPAFVSGSTTVRMTSGGNFSYAGPTPGFTDQSVVISATAACDISVAAGDCDNDGVPNAVEQAEGMNPLARDNDIFTIGRLFAMQQYRDFLGREGEPAGVQYWGTQVQSNAQTRAQVVTGFFNSSEFQGDVAPVVRLYLGTFLRIPDYAGVTYWVSQKKSGAQTLPQIAQFFATSAEFVSRYGSLSNSAFVTQLYQNILGRAPSASENAYWTGQLTSNAMTRGQVLLAFTDSAEHQAVSSNEIYVTMMYVGFLRRSPDAASFTTWLSFLDGGGSRDYMTQLFLDSAEYRGRFLP